MSGSGGLGGSGWGCQWGKGRALPVSVTGKRLERTWRVSGRSAAAHGYVAGTDLEAACELLGILAADWGAGTGSDTDHRFGHG